jgi:endonuclease YncB( thermonuclease family)
MIKFSFRLLLLACFFVMSLRATPVVSAVHGTITKVDAAAKTITVKTKDGTEETFHVVGKTVVHGGEATVEGAKDAMHGLKEGGEVVAHYTVKGGEKSAVEVDRVGKDGVETMDGTVSKVGKDGKTVVVKGADGTEHTFAVAGKDTADAAKGIGKGSEKSAKVTVYYTQEAGKKVAHFFEKL